MKKLLLLITALFLLFSVEGQILRYSTYVAPAEPDPEMITNGTFDGGATGWTLITGFTISGGVAIYDDVNNNGRLRQIDANMAISIAPSTAYVLTFDLVITSGNASIRILNGDSSIQYVAQTNYTNGAQIISFTTPSDIGIKGITIAGFTVSDNSFTVDNVSLKQDL